MKPNPEAEQTFEDRKRAEFKKLMECKWLNGVPTEWCLDKKMMEEALDFITLTMAQARLEGTNYLAKVIMKH